MQGPTFGDQACKPMRWALNRTTSAPAPQRNPAGKILGLTSLGSRDLTVLSLTLSLLRPFELKYKRGGKKDFYHPSRIRLNPTIVCFFIKILLTVF